MSLGTHTRAVEAAIKAAGRGLTAADKPLIELCRTLAAQMDAAGADASTRLSAAYLSSLINLRRSLPRQASARSKGKLAELRERRGS
jgi:hypothetical protein